MILTYNTDCENYIKSMDDKSVDIIVTDPPYGMNYQSNYRKKKHRKIIGDNSFPVEIVNEFFRIARCAVYVFCRWDNLHQLPPPKSVLAWVKNNWTAGDLNHAHGRQWEAIAFYPMEEHSFYSRIPDVIFSDKTNNSLHPTQKPIDLCAKLIQCNEGKLVFDPYMGSGSTGVAAKMLGRDFIGVEIDRDYFNIAKSRINETITKDSCIMQKQVLFK